MKPETDYNPAFVAEHLAAKVGKPAIVVDGEKLDVSRNLDDLQINAVIPANVSIFSMQIGDSYEARNLLFRANGDFVTGSATRVHCIPTKTPAEIAEFGDKMFQYEHLGKPDESIAMALARKLAA